MTAAQAQAQLDKIRRDAVWQLKECRRCGTPEMIDAIVEFAIALSDKTMELYLKTEASKGAP